MRVVLVACPNFLAVDNCYPSHVPLGLLSLAAVLEGTGHEPRLVDPNRLLGDGEIQRDRLTHAHLAEKILEAGPDLVGFSTLSHSYAQVLRVVEELKHRAPGVPVLLGGPQASVTDVPTLEAFPGVDFILRGEAETSLPEFLEGLGGRRSLDQVGGLTFRRRAGRARGDVVRTPDAPLLPDLDALPLPAWHHVAPGPTTLLPVDVGRGCPYACTFCSTCHFWRRRFRLKSVPRLVAEIGQMVGRYGTRAIEIPHDLFTVDRRRVLAFCSELKASGLGVGWSCFGRVDRVDPEMLAAMAGAGCRAVGYGVESGSPRIQRIIGKRLDIRRVRAAVQATVDAGMKAVLSFIVGFPEEHDEDLEDTLTLMEGLSRDGGGEVHLGCAPLIPYAGSQLYREHQSRLQLLDFPASRRPGSPLDGPTMRMIRRRPALFSDFAWIPHPRWSHDRLAEMAELFTVPALHAPASVLLLPRQAPLDRLAAFEAFRGGGRYRSGGERGDGHRALMEAFARYARAAWRDGGGGGLAESVLGFEMLRFELRSRPAVALPAEVPPECWDRERLGLARLSRAHGPVLRVFPLDVVRAVELVVRAKGESEACQEILDGLRGPQAVLLVPRGGVTEVLPLNRPRLLRCCTGTRTGAGVLARSGVEKEEAQTLLQSWLLKGILVPAS